MNEINGTKLRVWIEDEMVADATSHSLSIKMATRKTSNKDSGKFETKSPGRFEVTGSSDSLMVYGNFEAILAQMISQEPVTMDFGANTDDDGVLDETVWYASGEFIITGFDHTAGDDSNATYTISFEHYSGFTMNLDDMDLYVRTTQVNVTVHEAATGSAAAFVRGGIAPYTYLWTGGATTSIISGKVAGTYTVTVTDSSSNTGTATVIITEPAS
jgi:hypothetical protein